MPDSFAHGRLQRSAVVLVNLGTPAEPTAPAIRSYLAEFLKDQRVIEAPKPVWLPILYGAILPFRPKKLVEKYSSIWLDEGAPLIVYSQRLADGLSDALGIPVELGMRYGEPRLRDVVSRLCDQQVEELIVVPLYPQYSATTTATAFDDIAALLRKKRWVPKLRFVASYHRMPRYISALEESVRAYIDRHAVPDHLLLSFHGLPESYLIEGDPYHCQCHATARLLSDRLVDLIPKDRVSVSFQSRFGPKRWLHPYTDETVEKLAQQGVKKLQVLCPGFAADCLETLEEIAIENRDVFLESGGEEFGYIPALNDHPSHVDVFSELVTGTAEPIEVDPNLRQQRFREVAEAEFGHLDLSELGLNTESPHS